MLKRIETQHEAASFASIAAINLPWFCFIYSIMVCSNAFVFSLRQFTDDTRLLALIASFGSAAQFVVGPFCNSLSDRIWTRFGRRIPFVAAGWAGASVAMTFVPQAQGIASLLALALITTLLFELSSPFEPLCMEATPLSRRGRGLAVRNWMIQLGILFYFQAIFPIIGTQFTWPDSIPILGGKSISGESSVYYVGALLLLAAAIFIFAAVRERPVETSQATTQASSREGRAIIGFVKEVFGDRRWWWIYLLYFCALKVPDFAWGGMEFLMLHEQFSFSMPVIARLSLPGSVTMLLLTAPIMGIYADKLPVFRKRFLVSLLAFCWASIYLVGIHTPTASQRELPSLAWLLAIAGLLSISGMTGFALIAQIFTTRIGPERCRPYLLFVSVLSMTLFAGASWLFVKYNEIGSQLSAYEWFLFRQCMNGFRDAAAIATLPIVFDFVPKDKLGTLGSGFGIILGICNFAGANLAGAWVYVFTKSSSHESGNDYASLFLLHFLISAVSLYLIVHFIRAFRRGRIIPFGALSSTSSARFDRS